MRPLFLVLENGAHARVTCHVAFEAHYELQPKLKIEPKTAWW